MDENQDLIHGVPMPEANKLLVVADKSHLCGEFLDFLRERYTFCEVDGEGWYPAYFSEEKLLAEFFGINLKTVETERRALLDALRAEAEARTVA